MNLFLNDRILGAGLGQAVGDFVGFQVEKGPGPRAEAFGRRLFDETWAPSTLREPWRVGQVSDDTQMTARLIDHILSNYACVFYAPRFARTLAASPESYVGAGKGTLTALSELQNELSRSIHRHARGASISDVADWRIGGKRNRNPTNGGVMRIWPLSFVGSWSDMVANVDAAVVVTHGHEIAREVAVLHAAAVRFVAEGVSPRRLLETLDDFARKFNVKTSRIVLAKVAECLDAPLRAFSVLWELSRPCEIEWKHVSPMAVPTIVWALTSFMREGGDFRRSILTALSAGGDVDTVAAMVGTLCGASGGYTVVPRRLVDMIHDRDTWAAADWEGKLERFASLCFKNEAAEV